MRFEGSTQYVATADLQLAVNAAILVYLWTRRDEFRRTEPR